MDKKPNRCYFVLSFISPLQVAQHVSGNHVPIFRIWRLRSVIATCWYCAVTMSGIFRYVYLCGSICSMFVWFMVNVVWSGCVWLCWVLWVVVSFLQNCPLVQICTSSSNCKGVGNIAGSLLWKPFELAAACLMIAVTSRKLRPFNADFIPVNR